MCFLSIGGALGGIFNALLAPMLFSWTYEYEIVLVLACTVGLLFPGNRPLRPLHLLAPILLLLAVGLSPRLLNAVPPTRLAETAALIAAAGAAVVFALGRHLPIAAATGLAGLLGGAAVITDAGALHTDRSFFGVHRVIALEGGQYRALMHGNIMHGAEATDPAHWRDRLGYYSPGGPIGQLIAALPRARHFGVVGLGTGELACYAQPGQDWHFYEIDPAVLRVARDTRYFHFMGECGRDASVTIADGRLALQTERDGLFDLLVIDAFSSDAIPMHLLTREAFAL
ncbi:MAG: fused MFS/spermidine synthase [Rhodospirillales bacterium]